MWFKFPKGTEDISVQQQNFRTEVRGEDGCGYFRAPDHFAPLILMAPGFTIATDVPEGAPEDLPKSDPLRDSAISAMSRELESLRKEVGELRVDLTATSAALNATKRERDDLKKKLDEAEAKIADLEENEDD